MTLTGKTGTIDIGMPKNHSLQKLGDLTAAIPVTLVNSYRTNSRDNRQQIFHPCLAACFIRKNMELKYPRCVNRRLEVYL